MRISRAGLVTSAAAAALVAPGGSAAAPPPLPIAAVQQYMEQLPTGSGFVAVGLARRPRLTPLRASVTHRLRTVGRPRQQLERLATSSAYGAPQQPARRRTPAPRRHSRAAGTKAPQTRLLEPTPSAASAVVDIAGGSRALAELALVAALIAVAAIAIRARRTERID